MKNTFTRITTSGALALSMALNAFWFYVPQY